MPVDALSGNTPPQAEQGGNRFRRHIRHADEEAPAQ